MKLDATLKEVEAYNTSNATAIAAGLMEPATQSERAAIAEKKNLDIAQRDSERRVTQLAVLQAIWNALPATLQKRYVKPATAENVSWPSYGSDTATLLQARDDHHFVQVSLDLYSPSSGGRYYSSSGAYWRCEVGMYGNRSFVKVGGLQNGTNTTVVAKIVKAITERMRQVDACNNKRNAEQEQSARNQGFAIAHPEFMKKAGCSYYDKGFAAHSNGTVTMNYKTFTVAQWEQIAEMRAAHKAQLDALEASFKS